MGQFLAFQPYRLGFQPRDAVLLSAWRDGAIPFQAHLDGADDEALQAAMPALERALRSVCADSVLLVVYGPQQEPPALARVLQVTRRCQVPISHHLVTDGVHWRATTCSCDACPRQWTALPPPEDVPAIAEEILDGAAPLPGRDVLRELLHRGAPPDGQWEQRIPRNLTIVAGAVVAWLQGGCEPPELVIAVRAMRDPAWRDTVLSVLAPETFSRHRASDDHVDCRPHLAQVDRLLARGRLVPEHRRMQWSMIDSLPAIPPGHQAPVLTLIAANSWAHGSGAEATLACQRALELEPGYPLARLLCEAVSNAVRPQPPEPMSA